MNNPNTEQRIEPELECSICNEILLRPVSISCGHTFCKECLIIALRTKPMCPLCRSPTFFQNQSLNENITLRSLIESKYGSLLKNRLQTERNLNFIPNENNMEPEANPNSFSKYFTLKIIDTNKNYLFPFLNDIIKVSCDFMSSDLFNFICQDKKFICFPQSSTLRPTPTYIAECREIISVAPGKMRMEIKILNRVLVEETIFYQNESEDLIRKFELPKNFGFYVSNGRYIEDAAISNGLNNGDLIIQICEFFKKNLNNLNTISPNTFVRILHKIGENNINNIMDISNITDFKSLSKFSFLIAGSLRANEDEKRRMFETTNIIERLTIARNIINRLNEFTDPLQIFDVDIPTQRMFSLKYSLILIIGIILFMFYIRFYHNQNIYA